MPGRLSWNNYSLADCVYVWSTRRDYGTFRVIPAMAVKTIRALS